MRAWSAISHVNRFSDCNLPTISDVGVSSFCLCRFRRTRSGRWPCVLVRMSVVVEGGHFCFKGQYLE